MATLLESFDVKKVAFVWGGVTRIFRNNELTVSGDEDLETWITSDKKIHHNFEGVWLIFDLSSPYLQRVSPQADADNDWIDVKNAILDPAIDVQFYPIYSLDPAISYLVSPVAQRGVNVLEVKRGMAYPKALLNFITTDQLDEYPTWLRNTRYRG